MRQSTLFVTLGIALCCGDINASTADGNWGHMEETELPKLVLTPPGTLGDTLHVNGGDILITHTDSRGLRFQFDYLDDDPMYIFGHARVDANPDIKNVFQVKYLDDEMIAAEDDSYAIIQFEDTGTFAVGRASWTEGSGSLGSMFESWQRGHTWQTFRINSAGFDDRLIFQGREDMTVDSNSYTNIRWKDAGVISFEDNAATPNNVKIEFKTMAHAGNKIEVQNGLWWNPGNEVDVTGTSVIHNGHWGVAQIFDLENSTGNVAVTASNMSGVYKHYTIIRQGSTSRTVTSWFGGAVTWESGGAPTLSVTENKIDVIECVYVAADTHHFCTHKGVN